jgi:hypothetical protein
MSQYKMPVVTRVAYYFTADVCLLRNIACHSNDSKTFVQYDAAAKFTEHERKTGVRGKIPTYTRRLFRGRKKIN